MTLHARALIYWLGALPPLGAAAAAGTPGLGTLLRRFSSGAVPLVAVLVLSGALLAAVQLRRPEALVETAYGRLLAAKLVLVALMLALAVRNRRSLTPAVAAGRPGAARRLAGSTAGEVLLAVAVLALVAGFRVTPPPRAMAEAVTETTLAGPAGGATLLLRPGRAGANAVEVRLDAGLAAREVRLDFAMPARGIERIVVEARPGDDGIWRAGPVPLPLAGTWQVTAHVLVSDFMRVAIGGSAVLPPSAEGLRGRQRRRAPRTQSGLIATLRNLMVPEPCCRAIGPSSNRPLRSVAVVSPLSSTVMSRPSAVIRKVFHWPPAVGIGSTSAWRTIAPVP
jgi:copper transport protein